MVEHVYFYVSESTNPYRNLASQEYLFNNIPDNSLVFMLWQNNDALLLANNSNGQCNLQQADIEKTTVARRKSAGKTIYNDLGCLNYAFFMYFNNYNIINQINVIYQALRKMDLPIYLDENNEIMLEQKRISDNYYYIKDEKCAHFGTIYWDCDKAKRSRLIKENSLKMDLANITDYKPLSNMIDIKRNVLQSLADKYGIANPIGINDDCSELMEKYMSYSFIYDINNKHTILFTDNYDLGQLQFYGDIYKNKILKIDCYLNNDDQQAIDVIHQMFDDLIIDEINFKIRLLKIDPIYHEDIKKIYSRIKKESYHP